MATNTVQYPDGRQEIINVPKAFSVGDVVAVTHRRDGGVVVQRVSPIQYYDPIDGKITIYLGAVTSGQTLGYDVYVKRNLLGAQYVYIYYLFFIPPNQSGGVNRRYTTSEDWTRYQLSTLTAGYTGEAYAQISVLGLVPGEYVRIDLIKHRGTFLNGQDFTDGSFESNAMTQSSDVNNNPTEGELHTTWKRNAGGKVRIINTDAYSGSYCCEFYG